MIAREIQEMLVRAWGVVAARAGVAANGTDLGTLEEAPGHVGADWASNAAFVAARILKRPSREVALQLAEAIGAPNAVMKRVEVAGAGFLNFWVTEERLRAELADVRARGSRYGRKDAVAGRTLVELVSANPTGPLHVGHGRGAALGDALGRILEAAGYQVDREYYVNDTGNQILKLGESLRARYEEQHGRPLELPEDGYQGEYLKEIAQRVGTVPPERETVEAFQALAMEKILSDIREDLERFGVRVDSWVFESELHSRGEVRRVLDALKAKGDVFEEEGAWWFRSSAYGDEKDRVVVREDGRPTYLASDIAYHDGKFRRGYGKAVDVWGADHHGYVTRMKGAVRAAGHDPARLEIVLYQLVSLVRSGTPVPMSTRAGEFVTLREVVGEVGVDAARYFFLMRGPNSQCEFDLELAKRQSPENPVYYIQYLHARICSVFLEAERHGVLEAKSASSSGWRGNLDLLREPEELTLMRALSRYPMLVERAAADLAPQYLTGYLQELAAAFHRFYDRVRVLVPDPELARARLALLDGVRTVAANGLGLLGVSAPEHM